MKTSINVPLLLLLLVAGSWTLGTARLTGQTFTTLYDFTDLADPNAGMTLSGGILYGTTWSSDGYCGGAGTVFSINTDGSGFSVLHVFSGVYSSSLGGATNLGGASPAAGLLISGNILYGTATSGGRGGSGTVFALNTDGSGFRVLHDFSPSGSEGYCPSAGLTLANGTLYGTAKRGGLTNGTGTVFALKTDGTDFATLHSFSPMFYRTNSEGAYPYGKVVLSGNTLYGTTYYGGDSGYGTIFKINTDGTGFEILHKFSGGEDGGYLDGDLILSSNTLYGVTLGGVLGSGSFGTVFALETDGTGFRVLHSFTSRGDGSGPVSGLTLSGDTLYGAAHMGGSAGNGTVFMVNADGTGFTTLHTFESYTGAFLNKGGIWPYGRLVVFGNVLYGTASEGGTWGYGTVFSISLPPQLTISPLGLNIRLSWPTNFAGCVLESTTNLASPAWTTNLPSPVIVNGQNTVTNPISDRQQFFRLSQ